MAPSRNEPISCTTCHGNGQADAPGFFSIQQPPDPRQRQDHSGALPHLPRPRSDQEEQDVEVKIPPGQRRHADPLERYRRARPERGSNGDLYIEIRMKPHDIRARRRRLHCTVPVGMTSAALGGAIEGRRSAAAEIDLPEGTQHGKTCLRGKGIKAVSSYPGDSLPRQRRRRSLTEHQRNPCASSTRLSAKPATAIRPWQSPGAIESRICSRLTMTPCPPVPTR